ncbi:MAG: hypothetical protein OZ921_03190 [Sorangiineae bacterium]|nr:hypothetical protein [Polyangiaceae bacterium]MEB2321493.1 hypothetical protein [Sorangiineae bacterium]
MRPHSRHAAWLTAALSLWQAPALADEFGAFGAGARAAAMSGAGAALLDDSYAIYANPSGMAFGRPGLSVGFSGAVNRLTIRLAERPAGYDLPDLGASSPAVPSRYRLHPRGAESRAPGVSGFTVGATISAGVDWLRLGVLTFIPTTGIGNQNSFYSDEREQYFSNSIPQAIYGERLSTQQILLGSSVRPVRWLSIGAGLRFAIETKTHNDVFVPSQANNSVQYIDVRTENGVDTAPVLSAATRLLDDRLRASFTWRGELQQSLRGGNTVQINGFQGTPQYPFTQPMNLVSEHLPHQLALSAAWTQGAVSAAVDATWSQWSRYRDDIDQLAGFHDTVAVSTGLEAQLAPGSFVRGGVGYRPSPTPEQTGRTNYADNSTWIFGLGLGQAVTVAGMRLDLAAFGQLQAAVPRTHTKRARSNPPDCTDGITALCDELPDDTRNPATGKPMPEAAGLQTGNPGFPGWSSGGFILAAGVQISWRY